MSLALFEKHKETLNNALKTMETREYWSAYNEMPSRSVYGETAADDGKKAFETHLNGRYEIDQAGITGWYGEEKSPYGMDFNIEYPVSDVDTLVAASKVAMKKWQAIGHKGRAGVCLEILDRLNKRSFEIANAVMLSTGQGWMMAFQAGGPHAQDRGLEALAYAYREQDFIPKESIWEKPQGRHPSLLMKKHYEVVGRGVGAIIGCGTFPTWNSYPGLFATLATGNGAILKPHRDAILPAAITVSVIHDVLEEVGLDKNLVSLCIAEERETTHKLVHHQDVKSIDFTGSNAFGDYLIENCKQANTYAELAGVNHIVIDSTDHYQKMLQNIAFTLSLFSGQMCTTTQAIFIPEGGIETDEGDKSYDEVCQDLGKALDAFLGREGVAVAVLGALQSDATIERVEKANKGDFGKVLHASTKVENPDFPKAVTYTPVLIGCDATDDVYHEEFFGPISFMIKTKDTADSIEKARNVAINFGALTAGIYSTDEKVIDAMTEATWDSKVALSINLHGAVYVNQSAAFSDYHGTGGNPAANASYADSAFVANRFRVIQRRYHIEER